MYVTDVYMYIVLITHIVYQVFLKSVSCCMTKLSVVQTSSRHWESNDKQALGANDRQVLVG